MNNLNFQAVHQAVERLEINITIITSARWPSKHFKLPKSTAELQKHAGSLKVNHDSLMIQEKDNIRHLQFQKDMASWEEDPADG